MSRTEGAFTHATGRVVAGEEGAADKPRYRRYQHDLIAPHCGHSVLEVGAGLGEFAAQFTGKERLVVTDVDPDAVSLLKARFTAQAGSGGGTATVEVRQFDLGADARLDRPVHSAVAINVLEHFDDDAGVLALLARSVVPGGTIVLWVPGYPILFSDFDRRVGHFRRYTPASLRAAIRQAGLCAEVVRPVNLLGGLAWWAAMRMGRARTPKAGAVGLYDRVLVPATRVVDRVLPIRFGQSILAVARIPELQVPELHDRR